MAVNYRSGEHAQPPPPLAGATHPHSWQHIARAYLDIASAHASHGKPLNVTLFLRTLLVIIALTERSLYRSLLHVHAGKACINRRNSLQPQRCSCMSSNSCECRKHFKHQQAKRRFWSARQTAETTIVRQNQNTPETSRLKQLWGAVGAGWVLSAIRGEA